MSTAHQKLLLIEDDEHYAELVSRLLKAPEASSLPVNIEVTWVQYLRDGLRELSAKTFDIVLLDLRLPDSSGLDSIPKLQDADPDVAIVVLTGTNDEALAMEAVRAGAQDFLTKYDLNAPNLIRSLRYALGRRKRRLLQEKLLAAENALEAAGQLQSMLLPKSAPVIPGLDIAGSYWPFDKVGGDYFDYFPMDGHLGLTIADVSGHGLVAAMIMVGLRRLLRSCVEIHSDLAEIMSIVNRAVCDDTRSEQFVTAWFGRLDLSTRELTYLAAGHPAYVVRASGTATCLEGTNLPLGIHRDAALTCSEPVQLHPGDLLLLLTDGLFEAMNSSKQIWGIGNVLRVIRELRHKPADEIIAGLYAAVHAHCDPNPVGDDIAIIIVKVAPDL